MMMMAVVMGLDDLKKKTWGSDEYGNGRVVNCKKL